jgi:hypothetical protein
VKAAPTNTQLQADLNACLIREGDVLLAATTDHAGAMARYIESATLMLKLASLEPKNVFWSREAVLSFSRMADVSLKLDDRDSALSSYD